VSLLLQLLVNGVALGGLYALVAVGFALIYGSTRVFHFAHGSAYLLAAYSYYWALAVAGTAWPIALVAATVVATLFGLAVERWVYRPMRGGRQSFLTVFVASFGVFVAVENAVLLAFGSRFYTLPSSLSRVFELGPVVVSPVDLLSIAGSAVLLILLHLFLTRTGTGLALRAMADNPELLNGVGLDRNRYARIAFALGSALSAPAAVLASYVAGLTPGMGSSAMLIALAATIVGGVGSLAGAALGALLLGVAENVGIWRLPANWREAIAFAVLLVFLLVRPSGVLGAARR
jgi:branched-chain amino acid transport system permease protein